jgi:hypothetical protein
VPEQTVHAVHTRRIAVWLARGISYLVYAYLVAVEILLLLGFFLLLFGANPSAGFTQWVYRNVDRIMEPFRGIFTPIELGTTNGNVPSIFETSILFAMIIYGILSLAISALAGWLSSRLRMLEAAAAQADWLAAQERRAPVGQSPNPPVALVQEGPPPFRRP